MSMLLKLSDWLPMLHLVYQLSDHLLCQAVQHSSILNTMDKDTPNMTTFVQWLLAITACVGLMALAVRHASKLRAS